MILKSKFLKSHYTIPLSWQLYQTLNWACPWATFYKACLWATFINYMYLPCQKLSKNYQSISNHILTSHDILYDTRWITIIMHLVTITYMSFATNHILSYPTFLIYTWTQTLKQVMLFKHSYILFSPRPNSLEHFHGSHSYISFL